MKPTLKRLLCTLACCLSAAATAAPVFLEASVTATAAAKVWFADPLQSDRETATFDQPMGSQRVSASVYASTPEFGMEMLVSQDIEVVMNGADAGTVAMQTAMVARDPMQGMMSLGGGSGWHYRFRADADGLVRVDYDITSDPLVSNSSTTGAFAVDLLGRGGSSWLLRADVSGSLNFWLSAGEIYELVIRPGGAEVPSISSDMTRSFGALFTWAIEDLPVVEAVPEPGGLLLVLTALAAGAALRGRRR